VAKTSAVTKLRPDPLPEEVVVDPTAMGEVSLAPNELRELRQATGRTMSDLLGEEGDEEDKLQVMVWLRLRRDGHHATWDEAGDVRVVFRSEQPDPTSGAPTTSSPGSAGTGG